MPYVTESNFPLNFGGIEKYGDPSDFPTLCLLK